MYLTLLVERELEYGKYFPMVTANNTIRLVKRYYKEAKLANDQVRCKWANDIFLGDRKVSGSLIIATNLGTKFYYEIGIGINLKVAPIQDSTCLEKETGSTIDVNGFTTEYALEVIRDILTLNGVNLPEVSQEYRKHLLYHMQKVNIFKPNLVDITHTGIFADITQEGMAVLLKENGEKEIISTGRMRPTFSE